MIQVPFNTWSKKQIKQGNKRATTRTYRIDLDSVFKVGDQAFRITKVKCVMLETVAQEYYEVEGADSPEEFKTIWLDIHEEYHMEQRVFLHFFEGVELKENKKLTSCLE